MKAGTHTLWATTVLKSHALARRSDQAVPADDRRRPRHHGRSLGGSPDDRRSVRRDRLGRYRLAPQDLRLPPAGSADEAACATRILSSLARAAYRRPVDKTDRRHADGLLSSRPRRRERQQRLRSRHRVGAAVHSRQSGVPDPLRDRPAEPGAERGVSAGRPRAGVAAVVLSLEQPSGRPVADAGRARAS